MRVDVQAWPADIIEREYMNKENMRKWVDALRSGKYEQANENLREAGHFCALGVACDISGLGEWDDNDYYFIDDEHKSDEELPPPVQEWLGLTDNPLVDLPADGRNIAELNDDGYKFEEIADIIEKEFLNESVGVRRGIREIGRDIPVSDVSLLEGVDVIPIGA
jgi:hypothetical protein